jgi:predicted nucleic acid-binding protein
MISVVDTNILLDILIADPVYSAASKALLDEAYTKGTIVINEIIYAELSAQFDIRQALDRFLQTCGIRLVASNQESLYAAGLAWKIYRSKQAKGAGCPKCGTKVKLTCPKCGTILTRRQHILCDFLIGGYALKQGDLLLTRDRGYYQSYFPRLFIKVPLGRVEKR